MINTATGPEHDFYHDFIFLHLFCTRLNTPIISTHTWLRILAIIIPNKTYKFHYILGAYTYGRQETLCLVGVNVAGMALASEWGGRGRKNVSDQIKV